MATFSVVVLALFMAFSSFFQSGFTLAFDPMSNSDFNFSIYLSNLSKYILAKIGLIIDPCPTREWEYFRNSKYPAFSAFRMIPMNFLSLILSSSILISTSWSIVSKHLVISPSMNHFATLNFWFSAFSAE